MTARGIIKISGHFNWVQHGSSQTGKFCGVNTTHAAPAAPPQRDR